MSMKGSQKSVGQEQDRYECVHCGDVVVQANPGFPFRDPECSNKYGHDYV